MKLNKKGYMLVEIIVAFTLAMTISYYLLNLAYKFKNKDEDLYMQTIYEKDKIIITKNIMNDLERGTTSNITINQNENNNDTEVTFKIEELGDLGNRKLKIYKIDNVYTIEYGKTNGTSFDMTDKSYYKKELEKSLQIEKITCNKDGSMLKITIHLKSIYDDNDYSIKLIAQKS